MSESNGESQSSDRHGQVSETKGLDNFSDFLQFLHDQCDTPGPNTRFTSSTRYCVNNELYDVAKNKMKAAAAVVQDCKTRRITDEGQVQLAAFGYLKLLGTRTIENTSLGVKDFSLVDVDGNYFVDSAAQSFRKICFTDNCEDFKRVNLTLRVHASQDSCDIDTVVPSIKHDSQRLSPWHIVSMIELKPIGKKLFKHVSLCGQYCVGVLKVSPTRRFVVCALTNFEEIVYVAAYNVVENGSEVTKIVNSLETDEDHWAEEMALFFSARDDYLGYVDIIARNYGAMMVAALGRGSYSAVVKISSDANNMSVLKVSRNRDVLFNEIRILGAVRTSDDFEAAYSDRLPDCVADPTCEYVAFHRHERSHPEKITTQVILDLWDLIQVIHDAGYVHRDIRQSNIYRLSNGRHGLIDFSSAHHPDGLPFVLPTDGARRCNIPPGSVTNASFNVIDAFYANNPRSGNYACSFNDEVISLIFLAIHHHPASGKLFMNWYPPSRAVAEVKMNELYAHYQKYYLSPVQCEDLRKSVHLLHTDEDADGDHHFRRCMNILDSILVTDDGKAWKRQKRT